MCRVSMGGGGGEVQSIGRVGYSVLVSHPFAAVIEDHVKSLRADLITRLKVIVRVNTCIGVWASMI